MIFLRGPLINDGLSNHLSFSPQSPTPYLLNTKLAGDAGQQKHGGSTLKMDSFVDESWEEISNRLIQELKQEILNAELLEQRLDQSGSAPDSVGSPYFKPIQNFAGEFKSKLQLMQPLKQLLNSTSESNTSEQSEHQFARDSDLNSSGLADTQAKSAQDEYETQERHMAIRETAGGANGDEPRLDVKQNLKMLGLNALLDGGGGGGGGGEVLKVIEIHQEKPEQRKFDLSSILHSFGERVRDEPPAAAGQEPSAGAFELVEKVLHNYNVDLEEITKQVTLHNERLLKLKGKHLRNFFRRQLDQSNATGVGDNI